MKANEIKKLKKHSLVPVILILIAVCLPYVYVDKAVNEYESEAISIDSSIKDAKKQRNSRIELNERIERYNAVKKYVEDFGKLIPQKKNLPDIIDKFSDLAVTDEVDILDIRYMNEDASKDFMASSIRFDMRISGKYASIVKFLTDVEKCGYIAFNEEIQMNEGSSAYSVKIRALTK